MSRVKTMAVCLVPLKVNSDQYQPDDVFDPEVLDDEQMARMVDKGIIRLEPREVGLVPDAAPEPAKKTAERNRRKKAK